MKHFLKTVLKLLGYEIHRTNSFGVNSRDPYRVMRHLITNSNAVIFDVGANVGHTAITFRSLYPKAQIYCFEPFPESFRRLSETLSNDPSIENFQLALADSPGKSHFTVNQSLATNSLLKSDLRAEHYWGPNLLDTREIIEVKTETVDRFCNGKGLKHLDILKIDVQGAEFSVLEGARELLQHQRIDLVYLEIITAPTYIGQRKLSEYLALFEAFNYEMFDFYNPCHSYGRLIQTDNIFVSSDFLIRYEQSRSANAT